MKSGFLIGVTWALASGMYLASCTSGGGGSSGSSGGSSNQPIIDATGKKIYTVDPSTGATIDASGVSSSDPRFANAALVIPPGALSLPVDISIYQAQPLVSSSTASAVGSSSLTAAGPAVAVMPSQSVSITNSLAISIPYTAITGLTGGRQLVVIAIYPGETKSELETFVGSELDLGTSGVVKLSITRFGAFQVVYSDTVVEKKKVETNVVISQANSASANLYSGYNGSWWQGCFPDGLEFRSETVKISVDHLGNGKVEASASQYADQYCQFLLFEELRVEKLKFSTTVTSVSKIDVIDGSLETVKFRVPVTNSIGHQVCGKQIGGTSGNADAWQSVTASDCANTNGGYFGSFKALAKIEGNMLFVKGCAEGGDCFVNHQSVQWGLYMTRFEATRANFMLHAPKFFGDSGCDALSLRSDRNLTENMTVRISGTNFSMYTSPDCGDQIQMPSTRLISSTSDDLLTFYVKANDVTKAVNIDIRVADSAGNIGLVNRILRPYSENNGYEDPNFNTDNDSNYGGSQ